MRLQEIMMMLRENFILALVLTVIIGLIIFIGYFFIYKRILGGKKQFSKKQLSLVLLFSVYVLVVFALTFLNRGANFYGGTNLALFSSYREAWYNFSLRDWQYIYFNILMFVPFGFFLPLLHTRFEKLRWMFLLSFLFTGIIEMVQYITGLGILELDDLFNNVLGAMIGFGLILAFKSRKNVWRMLSYLSPFLLVLILSAAMFTYYDSKDYGNLAIVPATKVKMKDVKVTSDIKLKETNPTVPIYKAPSLTEEEAKQFAYDLFEKLTIDTSTIKILSYQNEAYYRYDGEESYHINVNFLNSTYSFTDFSSFDEEVHIANSDEITLKKALKPFGITIPEQGKLSELESGQYKWKVDQVKMNDQLLNGELTVDYYDDGTIKGINQQIVTYEKVQDIQLKSEQEAFDEVMEGKFKFYAGNGNIQQIQINEVEIGYELDSKGYYQPIYKFSALIDSEDATILIPAIK